MNEILFIVCIAVICVLAVVLAVWLIAGQSTGVPSAAAMSMPPCRGKSWQPVYSASRSP